MVEIPIKIPHPQGGDDGGKVVLVSGAYPPDVCGVGDYSARLFEAAPSWWSMFVERNWAVRAAPGIIRRLLRLRPSVVILQYPTQGFGWSLVPHLLVIFGRISRHYRSILALHEFSSLSHKSRLALALASHFTSSIVFTTQAERVNALNHPFFSRRVPTSIIGILSNIAWTTPLPPWTARTIDFAYFGHIRPNKGLETFLDVMSNLRADNPGSTIAVLGEIPKGYETFGEAVALRCGKIGCQLILGLDDQAVASALANIRILYLPFPDGASARRGSLLAGLSNGTLIATSIGEATPPELLNALVVCSGTVDDAAILQRALTMSPAEAERLQGAGQDYVETMLPRDWQHIAALYEEALLEHPDDLSPSGLPVRRCEK